MTEADGGGDVAAASGELAGIEAEYRRYLARRMKRWAVRWVIGFAIIWLAVDRFDAPEWLWWAGAGIAAMTPLVGLAGYLLIAVRAAKVRRGLAELDAAMKASRAD